MLRSARARSASATTEPSPPIPLRGQVCCDARALPLRRRGGRHARLVVRVRPLVAGALLLGILHRIPTPGRFGLRVARLSGGNSTSSLQGPRRRVARLPLGLNLSLPLFKRRWLASRDAEFTWCFSLPLSTRPDPASGPAATWAGRVSSSCQRRGFSRPLASTPAT